jgi:cytochrome c oxidase assembly factor CtaG
MHMVRAITLAVVIAVLAVLVGLGVRLITTTTLKKVEKVSGSAVSQIEENTRLRQELLERR